MSVRASAPPPLRVRPPAPVVLVCIAHSCIKVPWTDSSGGRSVKREGQDAVARAHVYKVGENTSYDTSVVYFGK